MFILNKNLKAGCLGVATGYAPSSFSGTWVVYVDREVTALGTTSKANIGEPSNYSQISTYRLGVGDSASGYGTELQSVSGRVDYGIISMFVSNAANNLYWNRMADGTLVGRRNVNISNIWHYFDAKAYNTSYSTIKNTYKSFKISKLLDGSYGNNFVNGYPYLPYTFSQDLTLLGAKYSCGVLRLGYNQESYNDSDYKKYISTTENTEWNLNEAVFSDGIWVEQSASGIGYTNSYRGIAGGGKGYRAEVGSGSSGSNQPSFRLICVPTGNVPSITPIESNLGILTEPKTIRLATQFGPSVTANVDGTMTSGIASADGNNINVNLNSIWSNLSYGSHTIYVFATANSYNTAARIVFSKSSSLVSFTSKPQSSISKPTICRLVDNCTVPTGAAITREVTNNGNDETPVWEPYTGTQHEFTNTTKTAAQWGLGCRITIDNSRGNADAEIKNGVAMGAIYKEP